MRMIKGKEGELQAQIHKRVINKRAILQVRKKKLWSKGNFKLD